MIWRTIRKNNQNQYFSNKEHCIYYEHPFWILSYTDFWSVESSAFFVTIKSVSPEMFAVPELKKYAEIQNEFYDKTKSNRPE